MTADQLVIVIGEGYATAASVQEAWPHVYAVAAFDAGNLEPVAVGVRAQYPNATIVIAGDDDHETAGNPGRKAAQAAAAKIRGIAAFPVFKEPAGKSDFNDLHVAEGLDVVREQLEAALDATPEPDDPGGPRDFTVSAMVDGYYHVHGDTMAYDRRRGRFISHAALKATYGPGRFREWLENSGRVTYDQEAVGFDPSGSNPQIRLNLYTGIELQPDPTARCDLILEHLHLLCGEREHLFDWMLKWIALPLQRPGTKMQTAVVMHSEEGTGKSLFWEGVWLAIYGRWGIVIGQQEIESQFNGWASAKLAGVADEVVSRQEARHLKGRLKKFVTGRTVMINEKNHPVREEPNALNLVFLSNENVPLLVDPSDRRYCVITCNEKQDAAYYAALGKQIRAGGVAGFYHYLLEYDLEDFTAHTKPLETLERDRLIDANRPAPLRFWSDWSSGELPLPFVSCRSQDLYTAFRTWCAFAGERFVPNNQAFSQELAPYEGQTFRKDRPRIPIEGGKDKRPICYVLPEVEREQLVTIANQVEQFRESLEAYIAAARRQKL